MLILKVVALGPIHGYGIVQRIQRISNEALQIRQGSLYPPSTAWRATDGSSRSGRRRRADGMRSSTPLQESVTSV